MRRFVIILIVFVVLVAGLVVVGGLVSEHLTESAIAKRIEQQVPGSHATVSISSEPFLVQLAASGKVESLHAHVTGVTENSYTFQSIDVRVSNLVVNRGDLVHGTVHLSRISKAVITATLSRAELAKAGLAAGLSQLGILGPASQATVKTGTNNVVITVAGSVITIPLSGLVPCVGSAVYNEGNLVLTCTTTQIPPALANEST